MIKTKIKKLRELLREHRIDGYIVPSSDKYMNEYISPDAARLEYITDFTGSNGMAIICQNQALFFTDGRYLEQSTKEVDKDVFQIFDIKDISKFVWEDYIPENTVLGYDPELFTYNHLKNFANLKSSLQKISGNLIDQIWNNKPPRPSSKIYQHNVEFAGESHTIKIARCRKILTHHSADILVITKADSICWLLNLRASDIPYSPLIHALALLTHDQIYLFIERTRITHELQNTHPDITICPEEQFVSILRECNTKILIDDSSASVHVMDALHDKMLEKIHDPCQIFKACKNNTEIQHAIDFHIKDAVALCEFFSYIDANKSLEKHTEYTLGEVLTEFRAKDPGYVMDSFPIICGFRENSAIIHYRASPLNAKQISGDGILLVDSGAQYLGCTTDVTRTITIGTPTQQQRKNYTKVLQGYIALSTIKFPKNMVSGANLDVLARQYLWQERLDYPHGTGHGVGSFLSVHEGPQSINLRNQTILQPGMILSNEPGYYIAGEYGIRIENLMYVKENNGWLEFDTLTLVPYAKKLIDHAMLNQDEINYLKHYYATIKSKIYPLVSQQAKYWLDEQMT